MSPKASATYIPCSNSMVRWLFHFILCNITIYCLPFTGTSCTSLHIISQRRRLGKTSRSNCCMLITILQLHSSSSHITSDPGRYILTNFDHDEEDDAVDDYHAEEDTKIYPLWSVNVNLEHVFQDVLARYLEKIRWLVVKQQALEIILVLPLKRFNCFSHWTTWTACHHQPVVLVAYLYL